MARGESATPKRALGGLATLGLIFALAVCVTTGVIAINAEGTRPATREPWDGMGAAFGSLGSPMQFVVTTPSEARANAEGQLATHGYVPMESTAPATLSALPYELDAAMDGACGVLLAVGDASTSITRVILPSGHSYAPRDAHAAPVRVCGDAHVRIEGTGSVAVHRWLFPGITAADVNASGLPTEVALAHAEASHVLIPSRLEATDEVVVLTLPSVGAYPIPLTRRPVTGCVPFVAVAVGADALPTGWTEASNEAGLGTIGSALCATRMDTIPSFNATGSGTSVYVRFYREVPTPRAAGPAIASIRVRAESALSLSDALPENAMP